MKSIVFLNVVCIFLAVAVGCARNQTTGPPGLQVMQLDDTDLVWDGEYTGLKPRLSPRAMWFIQHAGEQKLQLAEMLQSRSTFAVAHVILMRVVPRPGPRGVVNSSEWFGLTVVLRGDATFIYPDGSRERVLNAWWSDPVFWTWLGLQNDAARQPTSGSSRGDLSGRDL